MEWYVNFIAIIVTKVTPVISITVLFKCAEHVPNQSGFMQKTKNEIGSTLHFLVA